MKKKQPLLQKKWQENYVKLREFMKTKGKTSFNRLSQDQEEVALCSWVLTQRKFYKNGTLENSRIQALERLPGWSWKPFEDLWQKNYDKLEKFVLTTGHARPSQRSPAQAEREISLWVINQRRKYRARKLSSMRIVALERLSHWSWDPFEEIWQEKYYELKIFLKASYGIMPSQYSPNQVEKTLGQWVNKQRISYKKGTLPPERFEALMMLKGWRWSAKE